MTTSHDVKSPAALTTRRTMDLARERQFDREFGAALARAPATPGWLGGGVVAVGATSSAYDTRLHFTIQDAFVESISDTQRAWLKMLEVLSEHAKVARRGAQDAGILPPPIGPVRPRPRYKAALLGRLSFYHLIPAIHALIGPHVAHLPISARPGLTARVTPLMTWWVKPLLTRLTSTWRHGSTPPPLRQAG